MQEELVRLSNQLQFLGGCLQLQQFLSGNVQIYHVPYRCTPPVRFTVNKFSKLKSWKITWFGPDLYTHEHDYKIYCSAVLNEASTHVGVEAYGMQGEYDAQLKWPVRTTFILQLLNQHRYHDHPIIECELI